MNEENQNEENLELSSHEKKELKKQQKEGGKQFSSEVKVKKDSQKKFVKYAIAIIIVALVLSGLYKIINNVRSFQPDHKGFFHWHANINMFVCGEEAALKCPSGMCGTMLNHHHNDQIIHMEGSVLAKKEDISLGKFFDTIGIKFSETEITDKKNGDICNGKPAKVNLYVNGQLNNEYRNYIPSQCDAQDSIDIRKRCDKIEIKFE